CAWDHRIGAKVPASTKEERRLLAPFFETSSFGEYRRANPELLPHLEHGVTAAIETLIAVRIATRLGRTEAIRGISKHDVQVIALACFGWTVTILAEVHVQFLMV